MLEFLLILIFISNYFTAYQVFALGFYGVTTTDLLSVLYFAFYFKRVFWDGERIKIVWDWTIAFFMLFGVSVLLSAITPLANGRQELISQYIKSAIHLFYYMFFTFTAFTYIIKYKTWEKLIEVWLITSLFINVFAVYQIVARAYDLPLAWLEYNNVSFTARGESGEGAIKQLSLNFESFYRATSIFSEPSSLASYNSTIIILLFVPFIQKQKQFIKNNILNWSIFACSLIGLFLTFSLTGMLSMFVAVFAALIVEKRRNLIMLGYLIIVSSVVILISDKYVEEYSGVSVVGLFEKRLTALFQGGTDASQHIVGESFGFRWESVLENISIWKESPIWGIGLGLTQYEKDAAIAFSNFGIMSALSESGIIGFFAFVMMFLTLNYKGLKYVLQLKKLGYQQSDNNRLLGVLLYFSLIETTVNFFSANLIGHVHLWYHFSICYAIINHNEIDSGKKFVEIVFMKKNIKEVFFNKMIKQKQLLAEKNEEIS